MLVFFLFEKLFHFLCGFVCLILARLLQLVVEVVLFYMLRLFLVMLIFCDVTPLLADFNFFFI